MSVEQAVKDFHDQHVKAGWNPGALSQVIQAGLALVTALIALFGNPPAPPANG